jgi:hypothetical protein
MEIQWYHQIDLGNGIVTPGGDAGTAQKLQFLGMPADLTGKSVLDLCAWDGFYSFEAERRGARRVLAAHYGARSNPMRRLRFVLVEVVGVTLFVSGVASTLAFLATETPAEAARHGLARMPAKCEAGFFNHDGYTCWYAISDHPFLFLLSLATVFGGGAVLVWAQRHWYPKRGNIGA